MPRRYRSAISWVKRALAFVACALVACGAEPLASDCTTDDARTRRVLDALSAVADAEVLGAAASGDAICFGEGAGTTRPGPVFVLPTDTSDEEAAARLVHLLHHARHGRGLVAHEPIAAAADCDALVREALEEEAQAHVLEMQVRRAIGVDRPRRPFVNQAEILALPREAREAAVLAFLLAHPDGGGGYEPLARDYRAQCARR